MRRLVLLLVLLAVPLPLFAQSEQRDRDDRWRDRDRDRYGRRYQYRRNMFEVTPSLAYRWGGTIFADTTSAFLVDVEAESSGALGVSFGIPLGDSNMKIELMASRQETHLTTGAGLFDPEERIADFDVSYLHAGLQIPLHETYGATPFIVVSLGLANLDPQIAGLSDENRFSGSAGVGVKIPFNERLGLRVETRGFFTSLDDGNNDNNDCRRCDDNWGRDFYQGEINVGLIIWF